MLVLEVMRRVRAELGTLPAASRLGLILMPIAFLTDVFIHLAPAAHDHAGFAPQEHLAHLLGIVAMVLVLVGVVVDGTLRHRSRRRSSHAPR